MLRNAYRSLAVILIVLFSSFAHAAYDEDNPPDLFCEPAKTAGSNPAFGGKPVSLVSGMETYAPATDLSLGNLFPIRVTRNYNSRTTYDSPLGYGWAINYDKRLYTYSDSSATVRRECGKKYRFIWHGPGFISSAGDSGILVQNPDGTYTYTDLYGEKENYDEQGKLVSMVDAKGNSLVFSYTASTRDFLFGLLPFNLDQNNPLIVAYDYHLSKIEEKDASGNLTGVRVDFQYDSGTGRLTGLSDNASRTVIYGHDTYGNLTSVSSPAGSATFKYEDPNNRHTLTSIDEGQGEYRNTYDAMGRVTTQTHGTGVIVFEYLVPRQKTRMTTSIKDSAGNLLNTQVRTVEFDANGVPAKVTDTFGNITTYVRENIAWLSQKGQTNIATGITTTTDYSYDSKGNMLTKTEALDTAIEKTTTYTYDPVFSLVTTETVSSVVNPALVSTTTNSYDPANGNLLTRTESGYLGDGSSYTYVTTYTYFPNGKLQSIDGPRTDVSDITTYTYDPTTGALASVTQPLIGTTTYSNFDALGNPQTVTDPNGYSTTYTYDTNGRVATVNAPGDANPTQYFYISGSCGSSCSGNGKIDHITLPEGNTITYHYDDGMGNLTSITDSSGNSINYTYDSEGNKLTEQIRDSGGALQKSLSYSYDALNRLKRTINPDTTYSEYSYDFRGSRTAIFSANSTTTSYQYDELSRLKTVTQPGTITTTYGYNTNSNLTTVIDANTNTTQYKYDDKGRVYQVISPDTGTTTYQYDPAGNLTSKTDAKGVTISYVYDALNRLTTIDFPTDIDITYTYDTCLNGKGRLCTMTDASGTTVNEFSPKGQIKKETETIDNIQYVTQYTYDQNGNLKTLTYPSGRVITYNLSNDKVISVLNNAANLAANIDYKPFGGMSSLTYGNGIVGSISYDNQYRVSSITAGTVMSLSYNHYDANGNITGITNALDATKNKSFSYDALDRLSTATASGIWGSLFWTYDGVGNRQAEGSTVYSYAPGTNKLTGAGGTAFGYDNNGNTTTQAAHSYTYNQNQRLIQVVDGATIASYTYNCNGQRVKKVVNGVTTIFHYNRIGLLIAESDGSGATTVEYVYLNNAPLVKIEGSSVNFYHTDHLSTPQKMTDSTGTVVWSADYKPFGEAAVTVSTITNNLRFPGQYYDAETGLNYNYRRDYNPVIGRYLEADPIGLKGGLSLFAYAKSSPINWVDPLGLLCVKIWTTVTGSEFHIWDTVWKLEGSVVRDADLHLGECQYSKIQEGWLKEYLTTTYLCCECSKCQIKTEKTTRQGQHDELVRTQNMSMSFFPLGPYHTYIGMCYPPPD